VFRTSGASPLPFPELWASAPSIPVTIPFPSGVRVSGSSEEKMASAGISPSGLAMGSSGGKKASSGIEARGYLTCGILAHRFPRARLASCGDDSLVDLSCKGRGA
jgi:hypothetical protein